MRFIDRAVRYLIVLDSILSNKKETVFSFFDSFKKKKKNEEQKNEIQLKTELIISFQNKI